MSGTAVVAPPAPRIERPPVSPTGPDLRIVAGEVVRDLIRRDPALWAAVQNDPALRRQFGFDDEPGA
jgi:hypothetical protein